MGPPEEERFEDAGGLGWTARAAGPGAVYLEAEAEPSAEHALRLAERRAELLTDRPRSVHDLIPGFTGLLAEHRAGADQQEVLHWLHATRSSPDARPGTVTTSAPRLAPRHHVIAVSYGVQAERGELERATGMPWEELIARHAEPLYTVAFIGFTPGFPYLLGLPPELSLPRRDKPSAHIPAGAVAIAGGQAGIYPSSSPGGWWVIGTTDAKLFDVSRSPPALLGGGDTVRFEPTHARTPGEPAIASGEAEPLSAEDPALRVVEVWPGAATLQALPRRAVGHLGMAQAGALDPAARDAAQEIVGAPRRSAAVELIVPHLTLEALRPVEVVVTGGGARLSVSGVPADTWRVLHLTSGASLRVRPASGSAGGTSYLAVAGGVAWPWREAVHPDLQTVPSSDVRAGLGRALIPGDELGAAGPVAAQVPWKGLPRYGDRAYLRVHPGPQGGARELEALMARSWHLDTRDRTGARLDGPALALDRHEVRSQGVPWGAVQVPTDGKPVVLLSDRGRTGGYAVPGVVDPRDLWQLAQAGPGTEVWFLPPGWRR